MQRFILSAFSVLLATAAVAPTAQALPKIDSDFNVQTLRLNELDVRNKSDEGQQPYYPQTASESWSQDAAVEQESAQSAETTKWEAAEEYPAEESTELSLTELRHESLDRS
ncbi:MAG: hypothetical protein AAF810_20670 [Cyanobacteria bacterium P01_D01_bin.36]